MQRYFEAGKSSWTTTAASDLCLGRILLVGHTRIPRSNRRLVICHLRCSSPPRRRNMSQGRGGAVDTEQGGAGGASGYPRLTLCPASISLPSAGSDSDPTTRSEAAGSRACLQQKLSRCVCVDTGHCRLLCQPDAFAFL
eukprot:COSAG01_NODE_7598_length_3133_cov_1.363217_1_plen_139_part_00